MKSVMWSVEGIRLDIHPSWQIGNFFQKKLALFTPVLSYFLKQVPTTYNSHNMQSQKWCESDWITVPEWVRPGVVQGGEGSPRIDDWSLLEPSAAAPILDEE